MKIVLLPTLALALIISCSPANDRQGGDTGMADSAPGGLSSHDTMPSDAGPGPVSGNTSVTPEGILSQLNVANTTEIQLSTMAAKQAASAPVKRVAQKLVADHSKNRDQLRALAQKINVSLTPAEGGSVSAADSVAMPAGLQGKSGTDFDKAFIQHEINDHQSNIDRLQNQVLPAVQNDQIKAYLQKTVTDMQGHLSSLRQVQQQLGS